MWKGDAVISCDYCKKELWLEHLQWHAKARLRGRVLNLHFCDGHCLIQYLAPFYPASIYAAVDVIEDDTELGETIKEPRT